jgi:hypothetical protein
MSLAKKCSHFATLFVNAQLMEEQGPMIRIQPYEGMVECAMEWIKKVTGNPNFFAGITDINVAPEAAYGHVSYEMKGTESGMEESGRGVINVNAPRIKSESKDPFEAILNIALTLAHEKGHAEDFTLTEMKAEYPGGEAAAERAEQALGAVLNSEQGRAVLETLPCWRQFQSQ